MEQPHIFSATLGLFAPWHITSITLSDQEHRLDITVETHSDTSITCPRCGRESSPCSAENETWHHHDFFGNAVYVHARVPRLVCHHCHHEHVPTVPWSRDGSRFIRIS